MNHMGKILYPNAFKSEFKKMSLGPKGLITRSSTDESPVTNITYIPYELQFLRFMF